MDTKTFYLQLQQDAQMYAKEAMEILASMQGKETLAVQKDEMDESTSADLAAEKCIIDHIKKQYPTHGIYSEEAGNIPGTENYRWIIDPLDQTKEYIRGLNEYNCLIAVEHEGIVVAGVTLQHGIDTFYAGSKGNGATCNGKPVHVSTQTDFSNAFIGFNLPNRKFSKEEVKKDLSILSNLVNTVYRVRPFWDQAKVMGWVARGILDGNVAPPHVYKWHDIASSIILVQEAGGKVTDWFGNELTEETAQHGVIASNGVFHDTLIKIVQKVQQ